MPQMEIDPAVLRQMALRHEQIAKDARAWSVPPRDWLASFPTRYGPIADQIYHELEDYYSARESAGLAYAAQHDQQAKSLRESADAFERGDQHMGSQIGRNGQDISDTLGTPSKRPGPSAPPPVPPGPTAPPGDGPIAAPPGGPTAPPGGGPTETPTAPREPNGTGPTGGPPAAGPQPSGPGPVMPPGTTVMAAPPSSVATQSSPPAPVGSGTVSPASVAHGPASVAPGEGVGPIYGRSPDDRITAPTIGAPPMSSAAPAPFAAPLGPKDTEHEAEPANAVGDVLNEDVALAKTLLGGVLAAVESSMETAWAVAVLRGPAGGGVFITTNEGRGWLPAGVFLPQEVSMPWLWDDMLGADGSGSPWEGISDPARVLVEFGLAWGPKADAALSALVSSGPIDPGLRTRLDGVAMAGLVGPNYDIDLREFTPGATDRLGLTGSAAALDYVAQVSDSETRSRCIELAADAHVRVGRTALSATSASLRQRILAMLQSGESARREVWDELREADELLAAQLLSQRLDVGRVGLGELRVEDAASELRALAFERRCNELVFLLAGEPTRQTLRDAVYAHEQIVAHPLFAQVPAAVSAAHTDGARAVHVTSGAVTAPVVDAGPPSVALIAARTVVPGSVRKGLE
ncbi:type VII secretion target [Nocardia sp. R16R-3T]